MKQCTRCNTSQPLGEFYLRNDTGKLRSHCKRCISEKSRKYHLAKYGLTKESFVKLSEEQQGVCAICQIEYALFVDHDHTTGTIRGLLCFACNSALGLLKDNPSIIRRAAEYLEKSDAS